jgi:hypothetical protein
MVFALHLKHMKKIFIIGLLLGTLNLVQATTISAPSGLLGSNILNGNNAYEWGIALPLASGQQVNAFSVTYTGVTLTASGNSAGTGTLYTDLLNLNNTGVTTLTDNDAAGDYFTGTGANTANLAAAKVSSLNTKSFASVGTTLTWTITFTAAELAALNTDDADGIFDIGIDPDCHYTVSGLSYTYTTVKTSVPVPDNAATAMLLGLSLCGLLIIRRSFSVSKA